LTIKQYYEKSLKFYLAILNSKITWFFLQNTGTVLANGYFRFNPKYVNPFPLPATRSKILKDIRCLRKRVGKTEFFKQKQKEKICEAKKIGKAEKVLINLVDQILKLKSVQGQTQGSAPTKTDELEKQIDEIVYSIYNLTNDEIKIIES